MQDMGKEKKRMRYRYSEKFKQEKKTGKSLI